MPKKVFVPSHGSYSVPLTIFAAEPLSKQVTILVLPALGVSARFYTPLAEQFCGNGVNAVLFEQRGHGDSELRPSRQIDYGFREWVDQDIPVVVNWLKENLDGEVCILGHSLGGHLGACYAALHPSQAPKLILSAVGTPWVGAFKGLGAIQIRVLSLLIPIVSKVFGSYNGKKLGFGGHEAATLMMDWRGMAQTNQYRAKGMSEDFDQLLESYEGEVLCLRYSEDPLAPKTAVELVTAKFEQSRIKNVLLNSTEIGRKADHFNWVRKPEACVRAIMSWLD